MACTSTIIQEQSNKTPPNIVCVLVDDLGYSDVGYLGHKEGLNTPNVDHLAQSGRVLTQAYAAAPVCSPTWASILTGKSPASLQLTGHIPGRPMEQYLNHQHKGKSIEEFDKTISFINENTEGDQAFFVYLPLPAPHNSILPLDPWKGKSKINPYADFAMMIDDLMGNLFETIKSLGIEENTLVIFTSANGCAGSANFSVLKAAGHHPSYIYSGAKGSYLEGGHRVPFWVKWPEKIKPNSVCNQTIYTTDFMATCADLAHYQLKSNEGEDSYSMIPLFGQNTGFERAATIHHSKTGIFALRKGDWKLVISPNADINAAGKPQPSKSDFPEYILFNLKTDLQEKNQVANEFPEKVKELKTLLIEQIKAGRSTPGKMQENDPISSPWVQASFAFCCSFEIEPDLRYC